MARKKPPEAELATEETPPKPSRKVVESRVVTYDAPPDAESEPEIDIDYEPRERKKKTLKEETSKLRERWAKKGIAPTGNLRITIFKFTNEDDPMSGAQADKAYCTKFQTTEDAIDNGVHLEAAAKFGPGRYWLMIYYANRIVDQWEFRVAASPFGQVAQNGQAQTFTDPQNPGVIVQMPAGQVADPFADFDKTLKIMERMEAMRQKLGLTPVVTPQNLS